MVRKHILITMIAPVSLAGILIIGYWPAKHSQAVIAITLKEVIMTTPSINPVTSVVVTTVKSPNPQEMEMLEVASL